jgi:hypothetical protein
MGLFCQAVHQRAVFCRRRCSLAFMISLMSANGRTSTDTRQATGSLAPPRQCLVQISGLQHPKTSYVLLGLRVRPVGDEHLTIGLRPQRPRAAGRREAADELPDTGSHHPLVERVDLAVHRFVLDGRVVVVGMVDSNQILWYDSSPLFTVTPTAVAHRSVVR